MTALIVCEFGEADSIRAGEDCGARKRRIGRIGHTDDQRTRVLGEERGRCRKKDHTRGSQHSPRALFDRSIILGVKHSHEQLRQTQAAATTMAEPGLILQCEATHSLRRRQ